MTAGLMVVNQNGVLILDESYENYTLAQTGTVVSQPGDYFFTVSAGYEAMYPESWGLDCIIAVGGGDYSGYTISLWYSQAASTAGSPLPAGFAAGYVSFWVSAHYAGTSTPVSIAIPYRIYRRISGVSPSADGYGLRVWKSNGALAFDSGHPFMAVTGLAMGVAYDTTFSATISGLSYPYVVISGTPGESLFGVPNNYFYGIGYQISPSSVTMRPHTRGGCGATPFPNSYSLPSRLVTIR